LKQTKLVFEKFYLEDLTTLSSPGLIHEIQLGITDVLDLRSVNDLILPYLPRIKAVKFGGVNREGAEAIMGLQTRGATNFPDLIWSEYLTSSKRTFASKRISQDIFEISLPFIRDCKYLKQIESIDFRNIFGEDQIREIFKKEVYRIQGLTHEQSLIMNRIDFTCPEKLFLSWIGAAIDLSFVSQPSCKNLEELTVNYNGDLRSHEVIPETVKKFEYIGFGGISSIDISSEIVILDYSEITSTSFNFREGKVKEIELGQILSSQNLINMEISFPQSLRVLKIQAGPDDAQLMEGFSELLGERLATRKAFDRLEIQFLASYTRDQERTVRNYETFLGRFTSPAGFSVSVRKNYTVVLNRKR
jgi:hypothetical protein